jgi:hypothetical protein
MEGSLRWKPEGRGDHGASVSRPIGVPSVCAAASPEQRLDAIVPRRSASRIREREMERFEGISGSS